MSPSDEASPVSAAPGPVRRFLPVGLMAAAVALVFALDLDRFLTLEALAENRQRLAAFVAAHRGAAAAAYVAVYAVSTALSLPGGAVLSVAGGLLFGTLLGGTLVVGGATAGAVAVFLAARTALGDSLRRRTGPWLGRMEAGFRENALSYLLVLRLVPVFPFFLVNLVPAFLGVPLRTYVIGTAIGIVPGSFVFASVGAGLGSVLDQGGELTVRGALTPEVVLALLGLSALALLPVVLRRVRGRGAGPRP